MVIELENNFNCGERIKELRKAHSLSQERLALNAGITPAYLGLLERGKRNATVITIERICSVLEISLADFFAPAQNVTSYDDEYSEQIRSQLIGFNNEEKSAVLQVIKQVVHIRSLGIEKSENEAKEKELCYLD